MYAHVPSRSHALSLEHFTLHGASYGRPRVAGAPRGGGGALGLGGKGVRLRPIKRIGDTQVERNKNNKNTKKTVRL